jgi:hypothetical protein
MGSLIIYEHISLSPLKNDFLKTRSFLDLRNKDILCPPVFDDADPDIEFNPICDINDYSEEELLAIEEFFEDFRNTPYTSQQQAAVNFALNAIMKK